MQLQEQQVESTTLRGIFSPSLLYADQNDSLKLLLVETCA